MHAYGPRRDHIADFPKTDHPARRRARAANQTGPYRPPDSSPVPSGAVAVGIDLRRHQPVGVVFHHRAVGHAPRIAAVRIAVERREIRPGRAEPPLGAPVGQQHMDVDEVAGLQVGRAVIVEIPGPHRRQTDVAHGQRLIDRQPAIAIALEQHDRRRAAARGDDVDVAILVIVGGGQRARLANPGRHPHLAEEPAEPVAEIDRDPVLAPHRQRQIHIAVAVEVGGGQRETGELK